MNGQEEIKMAFTWPDGPIPEGLRDLESSLEMMISAATDRIDILTYTQNTDEDFNLNKSIEVAIRKNRPKIRIFTDNENSARVMSSRLKERGSNRECWYWNNAGKEYSKFHIKAILVDDFRVYLGSANLGPTAMEISAECGAFFRSREVTVSIRKYLDALIDRGRLVNY